jgi:hypothetical protein
MVRFSKALLCLPACALLIDPAMAREGRGLLRGKKSLLHRLTQEIAPAAKAEPAVEATATKAKDAKGKMDETLEAGATVVPADGAAPVAPADGAEVPLPAEGEKPLAEGEMPAPKADEEEPLAEGELPLAEGEEPVAEAKHGGKDELTAGEDPAVMEGPKDDAAAAAKDPAIDPAAEDGAEAAEAPKEAKDAVAENDLEVPVDPLAAPEEEVTGLEEGEVTGLEVTDETAVAATPEDPAVTDAAVGEGDWFEGMDAPEREGGADAAVEKDGAAEAAPKGEKDDTIAAEKDGAIVAEKDGAIAAEKDGAIAAEKDGAGVKDGAIAAEDGEGVLPILKDGAAVPGAKDAGEVVTVKGEGKTKDGAARKLFEHKFRLAQEAADRA